MFMNGSWESSFHWIEGMDFENLTRKGGVDVTPNLSMHPQFEKALKNSHTGEKSKKTLDKWNAPQYFHCAQLFFGISR